MGGGGSEKLFFEAGKNGKNMKKWHFFQTIGDRRERHICKIPLARISVKGAGQTMVLSPPCACCYVDHRRPGKDRAQ